MIRKDTFIVMATVSGITDPAVVSKVRVLLDTGDYKDINNPSTMHQLKFEWTPEETELFPVRRIGIRLIVLLANEQRFTVAESHFSVTKEFKEA